MPAGGGFSPSFFWWPIPHYKVKYRCMRLECWFQGKNGHVTYWDRDQSCLCQVMLPPSGFQSRAPLRNSSVQSLIVFVKHSKSGFFLKGLDFNPTGFRGLGGRIEGQLGLAQRPPGFFLTQTPPQGGSRAMGFSTKRQRMKANALRPTFGLGGGTPRPTKGFLKPGDPASEVV